MGRKVPHGWTKETMDKCREVHMDDLIFYHYNCSDSQSKRDRIAQIIEHYFKIECAVRRGENFTISEE